MNSWQNPFGASRPNSSLEHTILNCHEKFSDDDNSGDQVVYNHNHLESLRSLYQRGNQDTTQHATSNNVKVDFGQRHSMICSSLPSKQELNVWTSFQLQPSEQEAKAVLSLEKLHAFSFGRIHSDYIGTQSENYLPHQTQAENGFTVTDLLVTGNNLHKNNNQQLQSGPGPGPSQLEQGQHCDSSEVEAGVEEAGTWSRIFNEAEKLDENFHETTNSAACTAHAGKARFLRGNPRKHRFKYSIRQAKLPFHEKKDSSELQDNSTNMSLVQQFNMLVKSDVSAEDCRQLPMVERLEELFENDTTSPCSSYKLRRIHKRKETRLLTGGKRVLHSPSSRYNVANEDILDSFDYDESGKDGVLLNEDNGMRVNMSFSKGREQMMSDLFQEALNSAPVVENGVAFTSRFKGTDCGFSNRLQNVLDHEKQEHKQFMKILHLGQKSHDEKKCIDVWILAKSFEAKLMICKCMVERARENTQSIQHTSSDVESGMGNTITVIFSSRTSSHLEIEIGKIVRIHQPWKEIRPEEHDKIVVCAYFCEMTPT
ncbi:uncharacterized protein LOC131030498 isoform X1 [Cryptomeria japonica]|uniref:uncharacterized protein LOC131030498 isoform X1 n=1 Tax=Cryptomeria japonica TaxID=3369 RepID=UPI0027DA26FD|nr:uncharacterized protein LOC131030498 isoform X1 [Cryptomeria japonica]